MDLRDKLKFWMALSNYVDMIVRGTSPLSLPDAIANSLSYVKAFGGTEQRNLPDGYIERQFIYMMDNSYLVPDIIPESDWRIEMDFQTTSVSTADVRSYFGGRYNGSSAGAGLRLGHAAGRKVVLYGFDTNNAYVGSTYDMVDNTRYKYVYNNGSASLSTGGTVVDSTTFTPNDTTTSAVGINTYRGSNGNYASTAEGIYLYSFKAWNGQGDLVMDLVPAVQRGTVPVVGFYDTVSGTFKTATAGTFAAGGEAVPIPDAPMDIVSNNGKLVVHDNELPVAYKRLKDIIFDGEVYYVTDIYLTGADTTSFVMNAAESGRNALGCYTGSSSGNNVSFYIATGNSGNYVRYKDGLYRPVIATAKLNTDLPLSIGPTGTTGFDTDATWTELEFTCPNELYIGWLANATSPKFVGSFNGNITISDRATLVPCERVSDGAIGYYNINDNVFFENQGTGTPTTSGYDYSHCGIMTDGTVETINVHGKNLFDPATTTNGFIDASGVVQSSNILEYSALIPVVAGQTYTWSGNNRSSSATNKRLHGYDSNGNWVEQLQVVNLQIAPYSVTATIPNGVAFVRMSGIRTDTPDTNVQFEKGSTATTYAPYYNGGTATAEILLSLPNYTDEQQILSGAVTRKVGVKILDGTESWGRTNNADASGNRVFYLDFSDKDTGDSLPMLSTHFSYKGSASYTTLVSGAFLSNASNTNVYFDGNGITTTSDWKQWLADQAAAGTPVTIIYPLAQAVTEQVAPQVLNVQTGDNILEITQASLSNLELEAKYQAEQ